MTDQTPRASPRSQARIAGFLYLIIVVAGRRRLFHPLVASEQLWRLSLAAMLVMLACDVAVAAICYVLFSPVSSRLGAAELRRQAA